MIGFTLVMVEPCICHVSDVKWPKQMTATKEACAQPREFDIKVPKVKPQCCNCWLIMVGFQVSLVFWCLLHIVLVIHDWFVFFQTACFFLGNKGGQPTHKANKSNKLRKLAIDWRICWRPSATVPPQMWHQCCAGDITVTRHKQYSNIQHHVLPKYCYRGISDVHDS